MNGDDDKEKRQHRAFWRLVGTLSSLGWSLVIPIAGGTLLGHYIDKQIGSGVEWTIALLFLGVVMAFYSLYHILFKETIDD